MNRAGSFLYEPAGSVHTLTVVEDDTRVWFQIYGANLNLDADGNIESIIDAGGILEAYYMLAEAEGFPGPTCWSIEHHRRRPRRPQRVRRRGPTRAAGRAAAHGARVLPGDAGPARLLRGAEARRRGARRSPPRGVLGERRRRRPREPRARATRDDAPHVAGDGSAGALAVPRAAVGALQGQRHRPARRQRPRHHAGDHEGSGRAARRGVRPRRHVEAPVAGRRAVDGVARGRLADDPRAGRAQHERPGPRRRRRRRRHERRSIEMAMYAIGFAGQRRGSHRAKTSRR